MSSTAKSLRARFVNPLLAGASLLSLAVGCTGSIASQGDSGSSTPGQGYPPGQGPGGFSNGSADCSERTLLKRSIRALNGTQYLNAVRSLLPSANLENPFSASDRSAEFSTNSGLRRFDFNASQSVMKNADVSANTAIAQLAPRFQCLGAVDAACVLELVKSVGRELYAEPLTSPQTDKLVALFEQNKAAGAPEAAALVVRAMLSSPRFLFRKELGRVAAEPSVFQLTSHEVASAVAYTLTDAPPDPELRAAADADALREPAQIRAHVLRVLGGEAGLVGVGTFFGEYLGARNFLTVDKSVEAFPLLDAATRAEALADFRDTIGATLRSTTPTFGELLTTRQFIVRPRTAALLGWTGSGLLADGSPFPLNEPGRLGILTHPVIMATFAHQDDTNPVARGHLVSDKLLCLEVPPPPGPVMFPERSAAGIPKTLRQTLETEHSVASCAGCHQAMDPMGYPFEVFDAGGRLRSTDRGLPIDSTGSIVQTGEIDGPVQGAEELLTRIAASSTAHVCFTRHAFKYIAGVDDGPSLGCVTSRLAKTFGEQGGSIPELLVATLQSEAFLHRAEVQE